MDLIPIVLECTCWTVLLAILGVYWDLHLVNGKSRATVRESTVIGMAIF